MNDEIGKNYIGKVYDVKTTILYDIKIKDWLVNKMKLLVI